MRLLTLSAPGHSRAVLLNDTQHSGPSIAALRQAANEGSLVICETALAEIVPTLAPGDVPQFLSDWNLTFAPSSRPSALLAGDMFRTCMQRGGKRGRVVSDFLTAQSAGNTPHSLAQNTHTVWFPARRCSIHVPNLVSQGVL